MAIDVRSRLGISHEALAAFCRKWKIARLELFGSALREDFSEESDIDLLYTFDEDAHWSLLDLVQARDELTEILGRSADLVSRRAIEKSQNWMRKREILGTARDVYSAG